MENRSTEIRRPKLWTRDFIYAFLANLFMFFSFYLLVPVLPFYVIKELGSSESMAGVVLSLYTLSALMIRPFSGYMVDSFSRKPLYIICYSTFATIFAGYLIATTLTLFIILRVVHGLAFGMNSVSGNTLAVDIMPSERRGEGIGYFGMSSNIAMALGPMVGLFLYNSSTFSVIFIATLTSSLIGLFVASQIRAPKRLIPHTKEVVSLDRFILIKGLPQAFVLVVMAFGYGIICNYIGLYSDKMGFGGAAGFFFTLLALGLVGARLLSANLINKGLMTKLVYLGSMFLFLGYLCFVVSGSLVSFYLSALLLGLGFGYFSPTMQTMFINLAPHDRRGTANSTYLTSWDLGIGTGILTGGGLIEQYGFTVVFSICVFSVVVGLLFSVFVAGPYFQKNKLR
ncbi:MAG: MFS transporter [Rikenellaceae bacterium]